MIRWKRIQKEASKLLGREVAIHGTTELPKNIRAFVKDEGGHAEIMLNMMFSKTEDDVVLSLSHELAHVTLGDPEHGEKHTSESGRIQKHLNAALERSSANGAKVSEHPSKPDGTERKHPSDPQPNE